VSARPRRRRTVVVIARRVGRLANRLLLYAHFIGAALEHGFVVVNPSLHPYARYFPATARDLLCRFPPGRRLPPLPFTRRPTYRAAVVAGAGLHHLQRRGLAVGFVRLRRDQHLDLNSDAFLGLVRRHRVVVVQDWFFRNTDNCERHHDSICEFLTPWEHHLARAGAVLRPLRRRGRFVVGVHVRRGDYARFKGGAFHYGHERYRAAMAGVEAAFPDRDVSFVVCSDEPVPDGLLAGFDAVRGPGEQVEDLYALAGCDRLVGPPSTYTTWASYYGRVPLFVLADATVVPDAAGFAVCSGLALPGPPLRS
jgi:hypothetical protein